MVKTSQHQDGTSDILRIDGKLLVNRNTTGTTNISATNSSGNEILEVSTSAGGNSQLALKTSAGTATVFFAGANGSGVFGSSSLETNSQLALVSTTKGFTVPRMTTAQRDTLSGAIAGSMSGCIIFNKTTGKLEVYNGTTGFEAITSTGP